MKPIPYHPALVLAVLGAASGLLGTFALGLGYGTAPEPGLYMVLTGLWFGLVVGFGVRQWGSQPWLVSALALAVTWIAWEAAVNLALQLDQNWLKAATISDALKGCIVGAVAGEVGALLTWVGTAVLTPVLRKPSAAALMISAGALFGLLLPWTNNFDTPAMLLVSWQAAVGAALGFGLAPRQSRAGPNLKLLGREAA